MHCRTRRLAGGAAALGAAAILVAPLPAAAEPDDDGASTSAPAPDGAEDPAPDRVRPAPAPWLAEVLQPLVDAGTITEAQRDAVVEAVRDGLPGGEHGRGPGHWDRGWDGPRRAGPLSLATAAAAIGIDADDLREALRHGQTLAEIATANDVEPQAVIDALVTEAAERLEDAVADGRVEQADADEHLQEFTGHITTVVHEGFERVGPDRVAPRRPPTAGRDGEEPGRPDRAGRAAPVVPPTDEADAPATTEAGS